MTERAFLLAVLGKDKDFDYKSLHWRGIARKILAIEDVIHPEDLHVRPYNYESAGMTVGEWAGRSQNPISGILS